MDHGASYWLTAILLALCSQIVLAQPVIDVGTHDLLPNTAGQQIELYVQGGQAVAVLNFNAQIDDGDSVTLAPIITAVDIINGTIFDGNNSGQDDPGSLPELAIRYTFTDSGTVSANGLLASLTIDTTGLFSGEYPFSLSNTLNGPTDFYDVTPQISDGLLRIVPEPISAAVLAMLAIVVTPLRRCRQFARP